MRDLDKVLIIGNLTRDPESRFTPSGQSVASFAVATNRRWKGQDGEVKDSVEYHDVVAWGKLAEIAEKILKKGRRAYIEGRLQTRSWEGQDGVKRNKTEIVAADIIVLDKKGAEEDLGTIGTEPADSFSSEDRPKVSDKKDTKPTEESEEVNLDDIPF